MNNRRCARSSYFLQTVGKYSQSAKQMTRIFLLYRGKILPICKADDSHFPNDFFKSSENTPNALRSLLLFSCHPLDGRKILPIYKADDSYFPNDFSNRRKILPIQVLAHFFPYSILIPLFLRILHQRNIWQIFRLIQ